jgi:hypothetical protein
MCFGACPYHYRSLVVSREHETWIRFDRETYATFVPHHENVTEKHRKGEVQLLHPLMERLGGIFDHRGGREMLEVNVVVPGDHARRGECGCYHTDRGRSLVAGGNISAPTTISNSESYTCSSIHIGSVNRRLARSTMIKQTV